jgi:hypothetical protein
MIAAASFGLRRSGRFATATSGAAYWAASVRHGPPWPLPVNAPKSIFQNSILYRARTQWAPLLLVGRGRELWLQTRPYSHRAKHLGRHDHLGLVPPLIQLEKRSGEFRREQKALSRISGLSGRDHTLKAVARRLGVNRQQSLAREELGNTGEESRNSLTRPRSTDSFNLRAAARMRSILNQRA